MYFICPEPLKAHMGNDGRLPADFRRSSINTIFAKLKK
jgi:hypothetical protein